MRFTIGPIMQGKAQPFRNEEQSAIAKTPVTGTVRIGPLGLEGDEQADRVHHGGIDKAIHHYPHDHYAYWQNELGNHPLLQQPGAFGENITTNGLTEAALCLGDRLRLGSALVEVSQGRQPCWKLDHRFAHKGIMAAIMATARSGWYYRVIEPGTVQEGDTLELVARVHEGWSVDRVFRLVLTGKAERDRAEMRAVMAFPALAATWRARLGVLLDA